MYTVACPYHACLMVPSHDGTWSISVCGIAPLERWLEEDAVDGGVLPLQFGLHSRVNCTCIAMRDVMLDVIQCSLT